MKTSRMYPVVRKLEEILDYKFNDIRFLWEAVQAPGSIVRRGELKDSGTQRHSFAFDRVPDGNRRLAVLGDTVIKLAIVEDWYKGDESRERVSRMVAGVGANSNLTTIGTEHGFRKLINKNPRLPGIGQTTMASAVEAMIGAVYLDGGMQPVSSVMVKLGIMPALVRKVGGRHPIAVYPEPKETSAFTDGGETFQSLSQALGAKTQSSSGEKTLVIDSSFKIAQDPTPQ